MATRTGLDVCVEDGFSKLRGLRVGAICNPTSVDRSFVHLADRLAAAPGVTLAALFGPEHGIRGTAQYMVQVDERRDERTGVEVHSLYGPTFDSLSPTPAMLVGLDALVFDIQDVGSRYYTYVYTMALAMRAAGRAGLKFFVLDRPNPIGGLLVEGGPVRERYRSFVGLYDLPTRHGMTAGELARLFNERHERAERCELEVIRCEGWDRRSEWDATGLPFVPPSPNMPTVDTARVYPGMCLFEGTNVSEGRGTTRPFELWGAPFLDPYALASRLEAERLPGVAFRPCWFEPTFEKHARTACGGVMIHVTDRDAFLSVRTGIACLRAARALGGDAFRWRTTEYEFRSDVPAVDLLAGDDAIREGIDAGRSLDELTSGWAPYLASFLPERERHLLY
ncbi:exo-beta-N-acetylmuramidase NamZ domain-containing protein [Vulgatibacter incomptus]|uniref:DUF1343 domain-containing protein n=1 Tax=Vulgatibacter incomptus TaxID=1391653 RepID=A0A0K1PAB4_9BACT|nr:DUF1343 domain-containing protein [Vulgatibacter incomptus]AKU90478.1 hypothetical protein AKJ08_0865 [Vulgatibacter incomptus]